MNTSTEVGFRPSPELVASIFNRSLEENDLDERLEDEHEINLYQTTFGSRLLSYISCLADRHGEDSIETTESGRRIRWNIEELRMHLRVSSQATQSILGEFFIATESGPVHIHAGLSVQNKSGELYLVKTE